MSIDLVGQTLGMKGKIRAKKALIYVVCIILSVMSIFPFWVMIVNATRNTHQIQNSFSLIPSKHLLDNFKILQERKDLFDVWRGLRNSLIISGSVTFLSVYFSTLTAYAINVYNFKLKKFAFGFIMAVLMIPTQVSAVGFFRFMAKLGFINTYVPLIVPAIAAPGVFFFMKQYMEAALPLEIVDAARIDGSKEFSTFNFIALPMMKPAIATQAIMVFILNWNNYFTPTMILSDMKKYTLPIMVQLLRGDRFRTEFGSIYLGLTMTIIPIFIVYFLLSKHIIRGVALGGVKE